MTLWGREALQGTPSCSHVQFFLLQAAEGLCWAWLGGRWQHPRPAGHSGVQAEPRWDASPRLSAAGCQLWLCPQRCPLRRFHSATWLPPPGAGTRRPGRSSWSFCCLLPGHSTQGMKEHCSGFTHSDARVPPCPEWRQGHEGCARLPCDTARQLLRSYKEMPEPGAEPGADLCRLSITHWGGTGRGEEQPRTPRAWHDSAPGRSAAGARGVGDLRPHSCPVGYPKPRWGAALGCHHSG